MIDHRHLNDVCLAAFNQIWQAKSPLLSPVRMITAHHRA